MRIDEHIRRDVVVIEPHGRLTVETEEQFTFAVRRLLKAGWTRLILDLGAVPYIDSCGLGAIAQAYVSAWRHGGELKLVRVTGRNQCLLTITKLATVFDIYDSAEDAEHGFAAGGRFADASVIRAIRHSAQSVVI